MPDIDPITQEALRRASQMRGNARINHRPATKPQRAAPKPNETAPNVKPPDDPIKAFFKDKEESIILLLILLLMEEKTDPSLLLALMFLLL